MQFIHLGVVDSEWVGAEGRDTELDLSRSFFYSLYLCPSKEYICVFIRDRAKGIWRQEGFYIKVSTPLQRLEVHPASGVTRIPPPPSPTNKRYCIRKEE